MNARIAAILVVLLVVLGGGALVYQRQEGAQRPANSASLGQPLLKDLKVADIASIRIVEPKSTLTLQRKDTGWTIAERDGFPADFAKVRDFVLKALALKIGQSEPIGEKDRARLNLDASATQVELKGADGKALGSLLIGKKYFKQEGERSEKAPGDGRFVMLPADTKTVYVVSDPLAQANTRTAEWIDRSAFQVEKVKTLEVRYPGGEAWRIERSGDNADWKLDGAKPGEKLEVTKANAASYSLSMLELSDVAAREAKDDAKLTGLDEPVLINATTLDGLSYAIKVGKLKGESYFVSFQGSGELIKTEGDKDSAERIKRIEERMSREKLLSSYVLLIPKSKLEDTLKKRDDLLEKKDAKK